MDKQGNLTEDEKTNFIRQWGVCSMNPLGFHCWHRLLEVPDFEAIKQSGGQYVRTEQCCWCGNQEKYQIQTMPTHGSYFTGGPSGTGQ